MDFVLNRQSRVLGVKAPLLCFRTNIAPILQAVSAYYVIL